MNPRRHLLRPMVLALAVFAILLLAACTPSHPQSTFDVAGPVAEKQRTLFYIIFWAAVFVFILVEGILLYAIIRFRRRPGQQEMPAQTHGNTPLEIAWTIAPAILLAVVAVPTIYYIFDIAKTPVDALEVNVTGHQWWWEFEYSGATLAKNVNKETLDRILDSEGKPKPVVTANELYVPADVAVKLNLTSDDVIHSFWIPKLAGKQDVIPNNVNPMHFTARSSDIDNLPAVFFGQCAEFCGEAHANMRFRVIVDTAEGFDSWVAKYHEIAARPFPAGDTEEGKGALLFQSRGCLLCHKADGPASLAQRQQLKQNFERGLQFFPAPNLTNFGTRTTMAAGIMENDQEGKNLRRWLRDPDDVKPGNHMAALANVYVDPDSTLSEEDISALAAYLLSLR